MQSEVVLSNNCNKLELPISNLKQFHTLSKYLFPEIMKLVAEKGKKPVSKNFFFFIFLFSIKNRIT